MVETAALTEPRLKVEVRELIEARIPLGPSLIPLCLYSEGFGNMFLTTTKKSKALP